MKNITDKNIRALSPIKGKQYAVSDTGTGSVRGLSIMINPGGTKVFYFRYKTPARKTKRIKLGSYPSLGLSHARKKAREFKQKIDNGEDLEVGALRSKLANREIQTISDLWKEYHIDALTRKKSARAENQLWNKHIEPHLGPIDVRSFKRSLLMDFLVPYRREHSPALGAKIQALLSQLGSYGVERRVLEFSPAYQLGKKKPLPTCQRYLSRFELGIFWQALSDQTTLSKAKVSEPLAIILKILLLTGARRTEVVGMQWGEIDYLNQTWHLPKERSKNGKAHAVPISEPFLELLRRAKSISRRPNSKFVFPSQRSEKASVGPGHMRRDAATRACTKIIYTLMMDFDIEKATPHDLRRTCGTYMASDLKIDRFIISLILNHRSDNGGGSAVTATYARYDYFDEKKQALFSWAEYIEKNSEIYQLAA